MRLAVVSTRPSSNTLASASKHLNLTHLNITHSYNSQASLPSLKHKLSVHCRDFISRSRAKLGKKWMEYQGVNNWDGLLDPLDDRLRSEILRYGLFVEAAYRSFNFDPSSSTYATSKFSRNSLLARSGIAETGYRTTKHLRATCGLQLPLWINRAPSWVSTQSSWIGYVAVCQDKEEIARLGRRDVVIAYRGTATCLEWVENLRATLTCLPGKHCDYVDPDGGGPMVESGFLSLYTSQTATCPSLQDMVREEIARVMGMYGNRSFRCQLEKSGTRILRIVNSDDLITKVPGFVIDNNDMARNRAVHVAGLPCWLRQRVEDTQWVYAEVGRELRLSSKESPYLSKRDVATCHDLSTYLHLINRFVSSACPFRATAKKVLNRHHMENFECRRDQKLGS
ncbi:hypothetical protein D5086_025646 [Populus alba]|uniref:Uncharacterized protein n=1 Tax=Populus alba TaxID=43335 RepID=A0ACC4B084_POPAL